MRPEEEIDFETQLEENLFLEEVFKVFKGEQLKINLMIWSWLEKS